VRAQPGQKTFIRISWFFQKIKFIHKSTKSIFYIFGKYIFINVGDANGVEWSGANAMHEMGKAKEEHVAESARLNEKKFIF
jgi:hypothetical protein